MLHSVHYEGVEEHDGNALVFYFTVDNVVQALHLLVIRMSRVMLSIISVIMFTTCNYCHIRSKMDL